MIDVTCRAHDNCRIASGGADRTVILTDVGTGQPIRTFRGHLSVCIKINKLWVCIKWSKMYFAESQLCEVQ